MSEELLRDPIDTASRLQSMYGLSEQDTMDIMAAAPYAGLTCTLIDLHFVRVVDAEKTRIALTPLAIQVLSDLVMALLGNAQKAPEVIPYLHAGFRALGGGHHPSFPAGLDYQRVLPAMRLLLPRLVAIQLEQLTEPSTE